ncbi:uroporphyrinogen-III C-methyltransferase [Methanonatronarchaeum sp. AMET-Sl]|uniref:uroporphyrinogen-III C-methyltransferase n=1 Tax=Methanonatronarchaeum sp. AMET-Sl TaxID=3037654 RepID=UPI00244DE2A7|nr:uroporphyrinogen-III C-methyltransferase [Methanonatronarchaeum sp. AMET-Sl]WGI17617.1 uroporphyrinogen-III C-methyltransferase [Methanonatronarchaeum sp. AMET-Sl]
MTGKVYLIGAGPSKDLITKRGLEIIDTADVVVHDRLIDDQILDNARQDVEMIDAGKKADKHKLKQHEIEEILIDRAQKNKDVARVKGGDSFLFGRGGEEMLSLREADIPYEIIPGVTTAISVPARFGVPVTHRNVSSSLAIVTGHEDPTKDESAIDWDHISHAGTIVILMGVGNLPKIVKKILKNKDPETPVASFQDAYSKNERVVHGTLENITEIAEKQNLKPPAVTVIGEVVKLGEFYKK